MAGEFRSTPQLGPALSDHAAQFYWDAFPTTFVNAGGTSSDARVASYKLGNAEFGSDGHEYVLVKAHADIVSGAFTVTEGTFVTATGSGWGLPADIAAAGGVKAGQIFHARKAAL